MILAAAYTLIQKKITEDAMADSDQPKVTCPPGSTIPELDLRLREY